MVTRFTVVAAAVVTCGFTDSPGPPPESGIADAQQAQAPPDLFGTPPRHPPEVARLMKLLPDIPADGSPEDIVRFLGLPEEPTFAESSFTHHTMSWDTAPGYAFCLSFSPCFGPDPNDRRGLEFNSAGFSACGKPGYPPDTFEPVYPYRTWRGMENE
jgi:hypothetical protein